MAAVKFWLPIVLVCGFIRGFIRAFSGLLFSYLSPFWIYEDRFGRRGLDPGTSGKSNIIMIRCGQARHAAHAGATEHKLQQLSAASR
jgi:hypothetical protein